MRKTHAYPNPRVRVRQLGAIALADTFQEWMVHTNCDHTEATENGPSFPLYAGVEQTMQDVVVPSYRKRQKAGELFFNPMSRVKEEWIVGSNHVDYEVKSNANSCNIEGQKWKAVWYGRGSLMGRLTDTVTVQGKPVPQLKTLTSSADVNRMKTEASTSMLNKRGRQDSNLWETIAELDRTLAMIYPSTEKLSRLLKSAAYAHRSGRYLGYAKDGIPNLWLAYRYGISPIVRDIQSVLQGLQKKVGKQRVTSRARVEHIQQDILMSSRQVGIMDISVANLVTHKTTVRAMGLDEADISLLERIGFTSKGLITLPWELKSYSFVADWFWNIGDLLGALVPAFGWNALGSCQTVTQYVENFYDIHGVTNLMPGAYSITSSPQDGYKVIHESKTRSPVSAPGLVVKTDFGFSNITRVADAMALISQRFNRTFR